MERGYTRKKVSKFLGMPERAINYYTERKIVEPEIDKGAGRGKVRRYSKKNIVELGILQQLTGYGASFQTVEKIFSLLGFLKPIKEKTDNKDILAQWDIMSANTYIVLYQLDGGEFKNSVSSGKRVNEILDEKNMNNSRSVFIVNVGRIVEAVKEL